MVAFIFHNLPLVCLAFACVWSIIRRGGLLDYFMLWPIGIGGLWLFYLNTFQTEVSATLAGWEACNFQFTMGAAFLGLGINGIVGFKRGRDFRLAVILFASALMWGDLVAHFYQVYYIGEASTSNASLIMYADFLIPSALWIAYTLDL